MFNQQQVVRDNSIKSDIQMLQEQFIQGENLSAELSDFIFGNIARTRQGGYIEYVTQIKQILTHSKIDYFGDLMIIKSSAELAEEQKAVLVRFINLCVARNTRIIIFNNDITYVPNDLKKFGDDVVKIHINSAYREYMNQRKFKYIAHKFKLSKIIPFLH